MRRRTQATPASGHMRLVRAAGHHPRTCVLERRSIEAALRATNGNRGRAAVLLGMNRSTFYAKIKELGL